MATKIDPLKAYSEACNNIRHYSNSSLAVRLASIAQGIAILGAWAIAFTQKISVLMILFPLAGLFFSFLLYHFHDGYFNATGSFYKIAAKMEEEFFDKEYCRPIAIWNEEREKLNRNRRYRILNIQAPFTLFRILFILAFIVSVVKICFDIALRLGLISNITFY